MDYLLGRRIVNREFVQPSTHEARNFRTELNDLDAAFFLVPEVPVVWVWKTKKLDYGLLKIGLQRALNRVPLMAGRVKAGKSGMEVINAGSAGCMIEFQLDKKMPSESAHVSAWKKYGSPEPIVPLEPIDVPLFSATLTHFDDGGCCLFARFSHLICDGASMVRFMHIWSWETAVAINSPQALAGARPAQSPAELNCNHTLPQKEIDMTKEDLDQRLSVFRTVRFLATFPYFRAMDECADFEFTQEAWNDLKREMERGLSKDQWVSSYEALMAFFLGVLAKAEGRKTIDARAVVNIRGRSSLFQENYFGVGLSVHEMKDLPVTDCAAKTAFAVHESLRQGLKNPIDMEKLIALPQRFKAINKGILGGVVDGRELMLERARFLTVWENCVWEDKAVINSWVGYPWLDINFGMTGGDASRADFMRVPQEFRMRRHIHIAPISDNTFQLRMQLPTKTMAAFRRELKASGFVFRETKESESPFIDAPVDARDEFVAEAKRKAAMAKEFTETMKSSMAAGARASAKPSTPSKTAVPAARL